MVRLYRIREGELAVCVAAMLGVVTLGALEGILVAVALAILVLLPLIAAGRLGAVSRGGPVGLPQRGAPRRGDDRPGARALPVQRVGDLLR
jgi:hypothetical protein